jgi:hypothetical protein
MGKPQASYNNCQRWLKDRSWPKPGTGVGTVMGSPSQPRLIFPSPKGDSKLKNIKRFLFILAIAGMVLAMMLSMSASALAGDDPPDEVIQLNQKGINVFQRVML